MLACPPGGNQAASKGAISEWAAPGMPSGHLLHPHLSHSPIHPSMFLEYLVCVSLHPGSHWPLQLCPPLPVTIT